MKEFLKGKKTYIVAGLMLIRGLVDLVSGDITFSQFVNGPYLLEIGIALGFMTNRAGMAKIGK